MYVDWEYYKIFYYVAKYQNFTKAARVLGNNQPNITHSMNRLESQLNCVLFIRSNRGVTLTPEGEMLYSRIASAAVQIQDAEEELSASATLEHGTISISATETALNIYLSKKLRDFHTEYPGIRLRISNHSTPQAVQAVKNGEVDFAIVSTPAEIESGLKMVELKPFYEVFRMIQCFRKCHNTINSRNHRLYSIFKNIFCPLAHTSDNCHRRYTMCLAVYTDALHDFSKYGLPVCSSLSGNYYIYPFQASVKVKQIKDCFNS